MRKLLSLLLTLGTLSCASLSPVPAPQPPVVVTPPVAVVLPRIHVDGELFRDESGKVWPWAMTDGFRDYQRFLTGEDIRPILQQAKDLGSNGRRVFGTMSARSFGTDMDPLDFGEAYYERLPEFFALQMSYGQYVEWTVFADAGLLRGPPAWQHAHFDRIVGILEAIPNVFLELVNENDSNDNRVDIAAFPRPPPPLVSSAGSNGAGSNPPGPYWDYSALHSERRADRPTVTTTTVSFAIHGYLGEAGDSFSGTQRATVVNEPYGFDETDQPGRRLADPEMAYLMGIGCGYGAGCTAHSTDGAQSDILRPIQAECTRRFLQGVRAALSGR